VTYDAVSGTATIGSGLTWGAVYQQLQDHHVSVLGGRVNGVSGCRNSSVGVFSTLSRNRSAWVASYLAEVRFWRFSAALYINRLPTGYSFKSNQYGLAIDTIVGFNLVLPNGKVTYVTQSTHPDLFFGLKGGFNNFVSKISNAAVSSFNSPHSRGL